VTLTPELLAWIAEATGARHARRGETLQTLWGGYGELVRVALDDRTVVVKLVTPPREERGSVGDARKRRSYDVEHAFYRAYAARCDDRCRVAALLASRVASDTWCFVLEDLDAAGFPARRDPADGTALEACLAWLAAFHARFVDDPATDLWPTGTYWHLATRLDELADAWRERAVTLDAQLGAAKFQTILHGDPKEANFCFAPDLRSCAAVDFQYAGRGSPMRDVAYLLHGHGDRHLETYLEYARPSAAMEAEYRALFPVAQQDFRRFLAGWRVGR